MYFAVDPSNKNDFLRSALGSNDARKRVTLEFRPATSAPDKDAHIGFFDIVPECRVSPTERPEQRRGQLPCNFPPL